MVKIGVICGLLSEAKAVRSMFPDERVDIVISGANAARAEKLATALCQGSPTSPRVDMIVSAGVSGGLLPAYQPGDLVIGSEVVTENQERFPCDAGALARLQHSHRAAGISPSIIFGSDRVISSPAEKEQLRTRYDAKSVDMESHGAARAAHRAGVPFLAVRAIADPAQRALPSAALGAVKPDGGTRIAATLAKAAMQPTQFPALIQLGQDSNQALKTLGVSLRGFLGVLLLSSNLG